MSERQTAPEAGRRAQMRTLGYNDGIAERPKAFPRDPEYLRSYRRGVQRRLLLRSGGMEDEGDA